MNELALFAGAGGGLLASHLLGWNTICAVELDAYRRSVLIARQCDYSLRAFPIWDDIRTFDGLLWRGRIDVVSGGFPCQPYSKAARGRNTADDLWPEMRRVVAETATRYVFAENVDKDAIDAAADDLEAMGYTARCVSLAARDLGADHVRPRHWLRAYANDQSELLCRFDAEMAELPSICSSIWSAEPRGSRVADGVANRVDRITALGNGQVPRVAATAWMLLQKRSD